MTESAVVGFKMKYRPMKDDDVILHYSYSEAVESVLKWIEVYYNYNYLY